MKKYKVLIVDFRAKDSFDSGRYVRFDEKVFDDYDGACAFVSSHVLGVMQEYLSPSAYKKLQNQCKILGSIEVEGHDPYSDVYVKFSRLTDEGQVCVSFKDGERFSFFYKIIEY